MKSIKTKFVALLLCCVFLSTASVGALSLWKMTDVLYDYAEGSLQLSCKKTADKVNDGMESAEKIAARLARRVEGLLESPEILSDTRRRDEYAEIVAKDGFAEARPMSKILGIYLHLYPDDETCAEYNWLRTGAGDSFYAVNYDEVFPETDKKETMEYVRIISGGGTPLWTAKYMSDRLGTYLFSYAIPLLHQGHVIGTLGLEILWDTLLAEMNKTHEYVSEKIFLFDKRGNILYTPLAESSEEISQEIVEGLVLKKTEGNEVLSYEKNGQKGKAAYTELRNGMYLLVSAADSEIYKGQNELLLGMGQIFLIFLICTLLIALILANHMTRPLKKLEYATRKMSQGDFNVAITAETEDEFGELTKTFIKARQSLKEQMEDLETEAFHDELTGVGNKAALSEIEEQINLEIESGEACFEVAVLDVNMLKITNDTQGHTAGDMLLKTVAGKLVDLFGTERVFRIGGDEFLILSEAEASLKNKLKTGLSELEESTAKESGMHAVTCAFGTASFDKNLDTCFADVMERADAEMYKDKNHFQRRNALWRTDSVGARRIQIEKYAEFLRILSQSTEDYLFLLDIQTNTNWFFGAISEKYPIAKDENGANSIEDILFITHPGDREMLRLDLEKIGKGELKEHRMEYRWINKDKETVWINCRGRVIEDENGKPFVMIGRASDSNMRLFYNPLTGLFNKEKFRQNMRENLLESYNYMMLLHVDRMGEYNLKYGRQRGDEILKELATTLESMFSISTVYHMEQDRFALLLSASGSDAVKVVFEDIQTKFSGRFTVSAAVVPNDRPMYADEDNMYDFAKQILKANRDKGDATIVFFSKEDLMRKITSTELLKELEYSVENHCEGFYLCYQPQMDANSLCPVGAEVLLRYRSETKGAVYPDVFIPVLERTGLINPVGMYVLDTALGMCRKWRETIPDFRISVNFSVVQLGQEDLLRKILACLEKHGLPGAALTVEITESVQLDETEKLAGFFEGLHSAGVRISIDDFGTGYANLGYLRKIHANEIKIDRMFIRDIDKNSYNYDVISNTIAFSHANGIEVCLEGVEKAEELAVIESLRPEFLQGYLFAKPLETDEFEAGYILKETEKYKENVMLTEAMRIQRANMHIVRVDTKEILSKTNIGLWVIRVKDGEEDGELFADETMQTLLGVDTSFSPKEIYAHWYNRIDPGHLSVVHSMLREMTASQFVVQVEYSWLHPTKGNVSVRCTGKCVKKENGVTVFEGFHRIVSDAAEIKKEGEQ